MSSLCVFKTHRTKKYSTIGLYCVEDNKLSWESKGLHTYLISRPNGWKVHLSELLKRSTNGRHSLRSCLRELNELGYIEWTQVFDDKHKFVEMKYDVYEKSNQDVIVRNKQTHLKKIDASDEKTDSNPQTGFPHADFPYDEKPACGKSVGGESAPNNNHINNNQKDTNNQGNSEAPKNGAPKAFLPKDENQNQKPASAPPAKYTAEWDMWRAERGEKILSEVLGEKPIFDERDMNAFCKLREHGKTVAEITERFTVFCRTPNDWYIKNAYAFHVFAKNFSSLSPKMQRLKENTSNGKSEKKIISAPAAKYFEPPKKNPQTEEERAAETSELLAMIKNAKANLNTNGSNTAIPEYATV